MIHSEARMVSLTNRETRKGGSLVGLVEKATKLINRTTVYLPIPSDLQLALDALPPPRGTDASSEFFFWNGTTSRRSVIGTAERALSAVFKRSGVQAAHAHRFRHTLATKLLGIDATEHEVADILGITPAIIRKHYAKWSSSRQERISGLMRKVQLGTKTVHEKRAPLIAS